MGIFKWIMGLFKIKKNKARDYASFTRIRARGENKTEQKYVSHDEEHPGHEEIKTQRVTEEKPLFVAKTQMIQQKRRRRRRQATDLVLSVDEQQTEVLDFEDNVSDNVEDSKLLKDTETFKQEAEEVICAAIDHEAENEIECSEKETTSEDKGEQTENAEVGSENENTVEEKELLPEIIEADIEQEVEELVVIEDPEEGEAVQEAESCEFDDAEDEAVDESIEVEEAARANDLESKPVDSEEENNENETDEIDAEKMSVELLVERQNDQEPLMQDEENESKEEEPALMETSDSEESIETIDAAMGDETAEDEEEQDEIICDTHVEPGESEEEQIELVKPEDDVLDSVAIEIEHEADEKTDSEIAEEVCIDTEKPETRISEERSEKKERKVVEGNLYLEKQNVQRRVISEEEQLRKYILEQFYVQPLLGSIDISRTEFEYVLMPWFKKRVQYVLYGTNALGGIDPVFCVCLVQIAMRDSKHGEFWNHVANRLGYSKPTQTMTSRFGEIFIKTMKAHKKIVFDSGEKVASILMHCFVCDHHIPKLFDFLYAYYELDLYRHLELADVKALRDVMVSGKYYTRKQLILQQTEDVLKHLPELAIERFERYLTWIDKAYFDEKYQLESVGRFAEAFRKWRDNHPDFCMGRNEKGMASRKGQKMFSSPQLCLNLKDGRFSVVFPRQKIPFECDEAHWEIVTNSIKYVECEITEAITSNLTEETWSSFASADLLGRIQFRLVSGSNVLRTFEIEQDCCRAFSDDGSLIKNKHLEAGTVYCFTRKDEQLITEATCTQQQTDDWLLSCYSFETGMTIDFPDGTFAIVGGEIGEGICGSVPVSGAMIYDENRQPIPVYGRMPMLMLKTTQDKFLSGRMSLNGKYYSLENLSYRKVELGDRSGEDGYLITIPEKQHFIYDVSIDIAAENDVRKYCFAYIDGFSFRFENSGEPLPYLFAPRGSVTIFGNILLHGHDMEKHPRKNEFGFVLNAERQVLVFDVLNQNASLELEIPVVSYRFDQNEWRVQAPGEMWHTELPEKIEFRIPGKRLELSVDADADLRKQSVVYSRAQNKETIICDLMLIRSWLGREMFRHDIDLTIDGNRRHFAAVYARSAIFSARLEADYENNVLRGVFDIVGKSRYVVSLFHGDKIVAEQIAIENGEIIVELPDDVGLYKAVVYEVEEDEFGFGEQLYKIGEAECELIDPGNIEGKTFYIKSLLTLKHQEVGLPIAHKRYWVRVLARRKNEECKYNGEMRIVDMWGARPPIPVAVTIRKKTLIDRVQITFLDLQGEHPFLYDYLNKTIIQNENMALHKMEKHRRYEMLDYGDLFSVVYMKKEG